MRERDDSREKRSARSFSVEEAFANQVAYCRANDAPITARVVAAIGELIRAPYTPFLQAIADWQGAPLPDALPLRAAAGFHALHLHHQSPDLSPIYADASGINDATILGAVARRFDDALMPWLDSPPQTNEAARSCNFIAGLLQLAEEGCPARFETLEIGASAGINLMMDRYHYNLGAVHVGPNPAPLSFEPEWRGRHPPMHQMKFESLRGCDIAPIDLRDEAQADRLKAYIWPEHHIRFERFESAVAAAKQQAPNLIRANAADFVEEALNQPQNSGTTRVLLHSIVWQYIPADQQQRIITAMKSAGEKATSDRPFAWISLEANRDNFRHEITLRHWPRAPVQRLLGTSHAHAQWIEWIG